MGHRFTKGSSTLTECLQKEVRDSPHKVEGFQEADSRTRHCLPTPQVFAQECAVRSIDCFCVHPYSVPFMTGNTPMLTTHHPRQPKYQTMRLKRRRWNGQAFNFQTTRASTKTRAPTKTSNLIHLP